MRLKTDRFSLVPGPDDFVEPFFSTQLTHVARYPATRVARAFESFGAQRISGAGDDWFSYSWRWSQGDRGIQIGFASMEGEYGSLLWGGSPLVLDCAAGDLLHLWKGLRETMPAVWLHDESERMYKPDSFVSAVSL